MSINAESFAFGSSIYGGRPTFALTRRISDTGAELTAYEFVPETLAEARIQRFERAGSNRTVTTVPTQEIFDVTSDSGTDSSSDLQPDSSWNWDEWCGIKIATLRGKQLKSARRSIESILGGADVSSTDVLSGSDETVPLPEDVGVRLSLLFLGLKPIRRHERLNEFATGVSRMSLEECYYWHSQARSPNSPNGIKALRVLLTDHIN